MRTVRHHIRHSCSQVHAFAGVAVDSVFMWQCNKWRSVARSPEKVGNFAQNKLKGYYHSDDDEDEDDSEFRSVV